MVAVLACCLRQEHSASAATAAELEEAVRKEGQVLQVHRQHICKLAQDRVQRSTSCFEPACVMDACWKVDSNQLMSSLKT
eukprot:4308961-Amphidinium_carterae.1